MKREFSEELVSAYLDGELTADEQSLVEAALRDDADLRAWLEDSRRAREQLQRLPRATLDLDFASRVLRAAERQMLLPTERGSSEQRLAASPLPPAILDTHLAAPDVTQADLLPRENSPAGVGESPRVETYPWGNGPVQPAEWVRQQAVAVRRWRIAFVCSSSLAVVLLGVLASQEIRHPMRDMGMATSASPFHDAAPTAEAMSAEGYWHIPSGAVDGAYPMSVPAPAPAHGPLGPDRLAESDDLATGNDTFSDTNRGLLLREGGAGLSEEQARDGFGAAGMPGAATLPGAPGQPGAPGLPGAGAMSGAGGLGGGGLGAAGMGGSVAPRASAAPAPTGAATLDGVLGSGGPGPAVPPVTARKGSGSRATDPSGELRGDLAPGGRPQSGISRGAQIAPPPRAMPGMPFSAQPAPAPSAPDADARTPSARAAGRTLATGESPANRTDPAPAPAPASANGASPAAGAASREMSERGSEVRGRVDAPLSKSAAAEFEGKKANREMKRSPAENSAPENSTVENAPAGDSPPVDATQMLKQEMRKLQMPKPEELAERRFNLTASDQPTLLMVRLQLPESAARSRVLARGFADNGLAVETSHLEDPAAVLPSRFQKAQTPWPEEAKTVKDESLVADGSRKISSQANPSDKPDDKPVHSPSEKPTGGKPVSKELANEKPVGDKRAEEKPTQEKPASGGVARGEADKLAERVRLRSGDALNRSDRVDATAADASSANVKQVVDAWSRVQLENSGDYAVFFLQATPEQLEGLVEVVQRESQAVAEQQVTLLTANSRASAVPVYNNFSESGLETAPKDLADFKGDSAALEKTMRGRDQGRRGELAANARGSSTPYRFSVPTRTNWRWLLPQSDQPGEQDGATILLKRLADLPNLAAEDAKRAKVVREMDETSVAYPVLLAVEVVSDPVEATGKQEAGQKAAKSSEDQLPDQPEGAEPAAPAKPARPAEPPAAPAAAEKAP